MKVLVCADYSSYTEKIFQAVRQMLGTRIPPAEITVLHIIDDLSLPADDTLQKKVYEEMLANSKKINQMAREYFGSEVMYLEAFGTPQIKIDEMLNNIPHDLLVFGSKGRSALVNALMGSVAQHLIRHEHTPLLIVP